MNWNRYYKWRRRRRVAEWCMLGACAFGVAGIIARWHWFALGAMTAMAVFACLAWLVFGTFEEKSFSED